MKLSSILTTNEESFARKVSQVLSGYIQAIDFTECGPDMEECECFSSGLSDKARKDCSEFLAEVGEILPEGVDYTQVGIDFWLSRNGHGAGFFDKDYDGVEDKLQAIAEGYGWSEFYVDEDGVGHLNGQ